ncbi:TetR/AcrR family transcriptional regulator [Aquincola sp. S2]|uniref:TetR/AcrR family transcriptional regulator n=1 Tax=Pseudaquabacterium terrae TaxID=2732868 RepID=A0ABX2EPM0_9BURK|nr:TetR/AcrR family transcriptional regulator [Aquabacterium terrae]NRF70563.1 TetR/AcrR family transcriptional regulator [Aquabacterium terrae]
MKNAAKNAAATRPAPRRRAAAAQDKPDRRQAILLAAEKLFGLAGYNAVSIRDIAAEAGVPLALVGYYFGAKHELYFAIFESWQPTIDERLARLATAAADPRASDALERIVDAFVSPVIETHASPEGQYFAVMAARDLASPSPEAAAVQARFFDPMAHAFVDALLAACPGATRAQMAWCYQFALGAMLHFLLSAERAQRLAGEPASPHDPAAREWLLRFIAAGFRGVLPPKPASAPKKRPSTARSPA